MSLSRAILAVGWCAVLSGSMIASQDTQTSKSAAKPLTNADIVGMLKAGLSQEIVIAKINASTCDFDTSPNALTSLKTSNIPDAIILAMIKAHSGSTARQVQQTADAEVSAPARVDCAVSSADPVPVFSAPRMQQASNEPPSNSVEVFRVKCGDIITVVGDGKQGWLKLRTADGQVGYISSAVVSIQPSPEKRRQQIQSAADDFDDCKVRAENEYNTKINLLGTLAVTPTQRVYASTRLKQNLDAELRNCRGQYESRVKTIEAQ